MKELSFFRQNNSLTQSLFEQYQLMAGWNQTETNYPADKTIHQLFEEQVEKTPDDTAVIFEEKILTYRELNRRANELAHYLIQMGVKPETLIAISVERSLEMIVGLLGILKAGGAYVPLDPTYPLKRLRFMLDDTKAPILITQSHLLKQFSNYQKRVICLDRDWEEIIKKNRTMNQNTTINTKTNPAPLVQSTHLVYVIYTSGSTGKPKGVLNVHQGLVNRIVWMQNKYQLKKSDRVLQKTPFSFDVSVWEFFWPLISGAKLIIAPPGVHKYPEVLAQLIYQYQISILHFVPSMLSHFIEEKNLHDTCQSIRLVFSSGEALPQQLAKRFFSKLKSELHNLYGPTEAAIDVCYWQCLPECKLNSIPIGKPIANIRLYIVDSNLQPVPIGEIGELCIAGVGVARGYLNQPKLTAEKFVDDPFSKNSHLYRTGDLARYLPDGNIEYINRIDEQIKIRGNRIELGEIEFVIREHKKIKDVAVIAQSDKSSQNLIAYVVSHELIHDEDEITHLIDELQISLLEQLPDFMFPSRFVLLDKLPLNTNGKLDRKMLPVVTQYYKNNHYVDLPRNETEQKLAEILSDLLKIELKKISIYDDFFKLGGHSLLAIQLCSSIASNINFEVSLRDVFDHSTIESLSKCMSEKTVIKKRNNKLAAAMPAFRMQERPEKLPLSFTQSRLWFLDQLLPNQPIYHVPLVLRLRGPVNMKALTLAFNSLLKRHEILRTQFYNDSEGNPTQVIVPFESCDFSMNYTRLDDALDKEAELLRLIVAEGTKPFDLKIAPLIRVSTFEISKNEYALMVVMQHIISDGWSLTIMMREISEYYNHYAHQFPIHLVPLQLQYADYAIWQRNWLKGDSLNQKLDDWQKYLENAPEIHQLPTDHVRPSVPSYKGNTYYSHIDKKLAAKLERLGERYHSSLFMVLLSTLYVFLYRYTHQESIVVGTVVANRKHRILDQLIGFFANTLALKIDIKNDMTFSELLQQTREITLHAYEHQDVPFDRLIDHLKIPRKSDRNPLFQIILILQNYDPALLPLNGVKTGVLDINFPVSKFDLTIISNKKSDGSIQFAFEYATDLFEHQTIERMANHYIQLLTNVVNQPEQKIIALSLLSDEERHKQLITWNQTDSVYPKKTIHQLFEEQVTKTPDNIAVVFGEITLTYRELNRRANELAHYLIQMGVKPETLIAISVERSLEMIVGLLGILKAGGAYVPLDPTYPLKRLRFMLDDTKAPILITQSHLLKQFSNYQKRVICLDHININLNNTIDIQCNPCQPVGPDNLAYVIYTSGSTGKPKGLLGHHIGMVNRFAWGLQHYPYGSDEICCYKTSINFVDSITEIFSPLLNGVRLVIASQNEVMDLERFIGMLNKHKVTRIVLVPSLLQAMMNASFNVDLSQLKLCMVSGESLPKKLADQFLTRFPSIRLINLYGSSEVAADALYYEVTSKSHLSNVPIGKPIMNMHYYVLDPHLQPVPIGVTGELYLGGIGLAHGYLKRPDLTLEKFIDNPFLKRKQLTEEANIKLYRTGDLVRYLPDGTLDYVGRVDQQVKIRGIRIELNEIESIIRNHHGISDVAIIVREDEILQKELVTYIVPNDKMIGEDAFSNLINDLSTQLKNTLPANMIPSRFILLEKLPLNPNGKIDRNALPRQSKHYRRVKETKNFPRNRIEENLVAIWSELLKLRPDEISVYENFFTLGGHSLLATQLCTRIKNQINAELPLRDIFDYPTITELSERIKQSKNSLLIHPAPIKERPAVIPLSFSQQRLWFIDQMVKDSAVYNIPIAFRLQGKLMTNALEKALISLIERHETLRTRFICTSSGTLEQVILPIEKCGFKVDYVDLTHQSDNEGVCFELISKTCSTVFDLACDLLVRVHILSLDKEENILLIVMHHIISDGWSLAIMMREVSDLYNHYAYQYPIDLPPLPLQYADFALWQRKGLQKDALTQQLNYWQNHLKNAPELLNLPNDHVRPLTLSYKGNTHRVQMGRELTDQLKHIGKQYKASLFMVFLAGFNILLHRYTNQESIVIGSPIANRQHHELEGLIGFFVNTLALKTDIKCDMTYVELLQQVRETTLNAYDHQEVQLDYLLDQLQITRSLNRHPLFQVMFVFQNNAPITLHLNHIDFQPIELGSHVSKFDLTLIVDEKSNGNIQFSFEYATDLFEHQTIERMANHYIQLLNGIVNQPEQKIISLPLLNEVEKYQQLITWNQTETNYPADKTIHQLFEEQVEKTPDDTAIIFEEKILTYRELNRRANELAHYLIQMGVKPETLVAISVERSLEMIVGLLGILKAGGAYVPLDPTYPLKRLRFMLDDTKAPILITQSHLLKQFSNYQKRVICLDHININLNNAIDIQCNPCQPVGPDNLAYVIYTSGSTGKPKGVMVEHRGICNLAKTQFKRLKIDGKSRVLQFASISFDAFVWEWAMTLANGAILCLVHSTDQLVGHNLAKMINDYRITVATLPPSILATLPETTFPSLKTLVVAGEKCPEALLDQYKKSVDILLNAYGPTETTVCASIHSYDENRTANIIGKPVPNSTLYVLDSERNPVPIGVRGELYIGGPGLARGYLNQPELTNERFINNPYAAKNEFTKETNLRLYRTGDSVRYRDNGQIEFLGRIDQQIKIRGFRVELGEIESQIRSHLNIKEVVVIASNDNSRETDLLAYLVATSQITDDEMAGQLLGEIKKLLENQLPSFMIPHHFMLLEKLPLTPNGKIDKKSLPPPIKSYHEIGKSKIHPRNEIEQRMVEIWSELFTMKPSDISIHDNFFKLGGHSLLIIHFLNHLKKMFPFISFTVTDIFKSPTIALLAEAFTTHFLSHRTFDLLPIQTKGSEPPLFLIHPSGGTALPYLVFSRIKDRPIYGINNPYFSYSKGFKSISEMANAYLQQIKKVHCEGPYYVGGWSLGGTIALEVANQLKLQGHEVGAVVLIDSINIQNNNFIGKEKQNVDSLLTKAIETEHRKAELLLREYKVPLYDGRVILLKASAVDSSQTIWKQTITTDSLNGWGNVLTQLEVYPVQGTHHTLLDYDNALILIDKLQQILANIASMQKLPLGFLK